VVATAGHVDHGKSTLVEALTGTDPDRWAEEKARGLTIDLGFAATTLPSGRELELVDVPGHHRFVSNMLAGAASADACLFVVSAREGWKAQSEEHLHVLELYGIERGVVAITHTAGLTAPDRCAATALIATHLAGTFLDRAPMVAVDAPAGVGLTELRDALESVLAGAAERDDRDRPRLWVDRSFTITGAGTIVTGTLTGGSLRVGDELQLFRSKATSSPLPTARRIHVRGLQSFGREVAVAGPGQRVAARLGGVDRRAVGRGDALVHPEQWFASRVLDVSLRALPRAAAITRRGAHLVHVGTGTYSVTLRVIGGEAIEPGSPGFARLRLPVALPLLPGDRFVLRDAGRGATVGGGEILDVAPALPASKASPDRTVERVVRERGWVDADELERLTGRRAAPTVGRWVVSSAAQELAEETLRTRVREAGAAGVPLASLDERDRCLIASLPGVASIGSSLVQCEEADPLLAHPYLAALEGSPFAPPPPDGIAPAELRALAERGLALERDGVWFAPSAVREAGRRVNGLLASSPDGVTVAEVRDLLGTSRRWVVPLLGLLDEAGYTRRQNGLRVRGGRAPGGDV
jgi:selenocysteine-specific elongation factor